MNKERAMTLKPGNRVHYTGPGAPKCQDKRSNTWRVSGQPKDFKREANKHRWYVPIKFGLYESATINESNAHDFHVEGECPYGP